MNLRHPILAAALLLGAGAAIAQQAPGGAPSSPGTRPGLPMTPAPTLGQTQQNPAQPQTQAQTGSQTTTQAMGAGFIRELQATQFLASRLDGADVHNSGDEKIADLEDLVITPEGDIVAVILAYGGVAGVGQSYVAVQPSSLRMSKDSDGETRIQTSLTLDQLREAPTFSYSNSN